MTFLTKYCPGSLVPGTLLTEPPHTLGSSILTLLRAAGRVFCPVSLGSTVGRLLMTGRGDAFSVGIVMPVAVTGTRSPGEGSLLVSPVGSESLSFCLQQCPGKSPEATSAVCLPPALGSGRPLWVLPTTVSLGPTDGLPLCMCLPRLLAGFPLSESCPSSPPLVLVWFFLSVWTLEIHFILWARIGAIAVRRAA